MSNTKDAAKPLVHNLQGQRLGRKGRITRERILSAADTVIRETEDLQISLSAVAREADIGMSSLYNYFADFTEVLIALHDRIMVDAEAAYLGQLRSRWPDDELHSRSAAFLAGFAGFWRANSNLLHMRNNVADQRDRIMIEYRLGAAKEIITLFVEQMDCEPDGEDRAAHAMASTLYMGIERTLSVLNNPEVPRSLLGQFSPDAETYLGSQTLLLEFGIRQMREQCGNALA